jgi:hypothetical protein
MSQDILQFFCDVADFCKMISNGHARKKKEEHYCPSFKFTLVERNRAAN